MKSRNTFFLYGNFAQIILQEFVSLSKYIYSERQKHTFSTAGTLAVITVKGVSINWPSLTKYMGINATV